MKPLRYVLFGDAQSPHLLKWARALADAPALDLWVASSRGFLPAFDALLPPAKRLALDTRPHPGGGNLALLGQLPRLARWLNNVDADWLNPHYLTSHGTLAWLSKRLWGVKANLVGSAWGSDILDTPLRSSVLRVLTSRVLRACVLTTSDSQVMALRMADMGARDVMVFPFGLEAMPPESEEKDNDLYFANRGLEPLYEPHRVLAQFAAVAGENGRLVVANDGSLGPILAQQARDLGLVDRVAFVGRLDAQAQANWYRRARWYLSLPSTDSVAVSVLEAMAHGCVPLLSDLPANRELVRHGENGLIVPQGGCLDRKHLDALLPRADELARGNRDWVARHALFAPAVGRYLARLRELSPQ